MIFLRPDRTMQAAVDRARGHPSAVAVDSVGGGTLIAPRWVLTAAHVVDALWPGEGAVRVGDRSYAIENSFVHPLGRAMAFGQPAEVDLALIRLAEPVDGVTPALLAEAPCEVGDDVTLVGFGDYALASPGGDVRPSPPDGNARAATNRVAEVRELRLVLILDEDGTELEGVGAPGDSGGPLYADVDGAQRLVGVSSGGAGPWGQYGMQDVYVRVSVFRDWVQRTIAEWEGAGQDGTEVAGRGWHAAEGPTGSAVGSMVEAFFQAWEPGTVEGLEVFGASRRSPAAERRMPSGMWAQELAPIRGALASSRIARYAETDRRAVALVRLDGDDGWLQIWFDLDEEGRLDAVVLGPGAPPPL